MATSIMWVKAIRHYHNLIVGNLLLFVNGLVNQLNIDTDAPASGIPGPFTMTTFKSQINDVDVDAVSRQNTKAVSLTKDEEGKVGKLILSADVIVHYIESCLNQKYPNDEAAVEAGFARFGLNIVVHGTGHKHIFKVLEVGPGYVEIECPSGGQGACYHWCWSPDEKTWTVLRSSHKSIVIIQNLPGDARAYFRFDISVSLGKGVEPVLDAHAADYQWSGPISEMIPAIKSSGRPIPLIK
jgi:hypothetical protein